MPLAIPTPVVLILVEYISAVYWNEKMNVIDKKNLHKFVHNMNL